MTEIERRLLRRLLDADSKGLPRSSIPGGCSELIRSLQACGAVDFRPAEHGRGVVLKIAESLVFQRFISARLPQGLDIDVTALADRAMAVALLADAKAVRQGIGEGLFVRSVHPGVELRSVDGNVSISVSELTARAGGVGVQLSAERAWTFSGEIAVVENADAFWRYELVLPNVQLAVFGSGNMSCRLLEWLASPQMAECQIIHWGDYDPVGVCEYLRLSDACPGRVVPHAPPEIEELLPRFGKRRLITKQSAYLDQLRCRASDPHVRRMIALFDGHRRGLEQEILLRRPS